MRWGVGPHTTKDLNAHGHAADAKWILIMLFTAGCYSLDMLKMRQSAVMNSISPRESTL